LAKFIVGVTNIHISDGMAIRDHCSVVQTFEKGRFIVHASFKLVRAENATAAEVSSDVAAALAIVEQRLHVV
jgi:hypothetical protein